MKQKTLPAIKGEAYYAENLIRNKSFIKAIKDIREKYLPEGKPAEKVEFSSIREFANLSGDIEDLLVTKKLDVNKWFDYFLAYVLSGNPNETPTEYLQSKRGYAYIKCEDALKADQTEMRKEIGEFLKPFGVDLPSKKDIDPETDYYRKLIKIHPFFSRYEDKIDMANLGKPNNDELQILKDIVKSYAQEDRKDCLITVDDLHSYEKIPKSRLQDIEKHYPVNIRINPNANKQNILDFINENYERIAAFGRIYKDLGREEHGESNLELEDLIWEEYKKGKTHKEIAVVVMRHFQEKKFENKHPKASYNTGYMCFTGEQISKKVYQIKKKREK